MKRLLKNLLCPAVLVAACGLVFSSCDTEEIVPEPDPDPDVHAPSVTLSDTIVNAPVEGGEFEITYLVENPVDGESLRFDNVPEWTYFNMETPGVISILVTGNDKSSPREAVVVGHYTDDVEVKITIRQEYAAAFSVTFANRTECSMEVKIVPEDKQMTFLFFYQEESQFNGYGSDEGYLDYMMEYYTSLAKVQGLTLKQYLAKQLRKGDQESILIEKLVPSRTYIISCIGYDLEKGEYTTGMNKFNSDTKSIDMVDITFTMDADVDGAVIDVHVVPSDDEQQYMAASAQSDVLVSSHDIITATQQSLYQTYELLMFYGYTMEQIVDAYCHVGEQTIGFELALNTSYCIFAVSVDRSTGYLNSEAEVILVKTEGEQTHSDNVITAELVDVRDYTATAMIHTTNDDPYIVGYTSAEYFPGMTEEEIVEDLFSGRFTLPTKTRRGDCEFYMQGLEPKTDWYIFAYGSAGGKVTTDVYLKKFTTNDVMYGDVSLDLEFDKYYDGDALLEAYPDVFSQLEVSGNAVIPVKAFPDGDIESYHYKILAWDSSASSDHSIDLFLKMGSVTDPETYFVIPYDTVCSIVGNAYDKDGFPGKPFRAEGLTFTKEGVSPVSEFVPFASGAAAVRAEDYMQMPIDNSYDELKARLK